MHDVRIHLAGRERRRHAVREKQRRIRGGFVLAAGVEQLHRVVRVEVEQPGNDRLGIGERDSLGVRRRDRQVAADAQELAGANHDAGIADAVVAGRGEEPAAGDDDVALLGGQRGGDQREQQGGDAQLHKMRPRSDVSVDFCLVPLQLGSSVGKPQASYSHGNVMVDPTPDLIP